MSSKRVTSLTYRGGVKGRCTPATPARLAVASPVHARPGEGNGRGEGHLRGISYSVLRSPARTPPLEDSYDFAGQMWGGLRWWLKLTKEFCTLSLSIRLVINLVVTGDFVLVVYTCISVSSTTSS